MSEDIASLVRTWGGNQGTNAASALMGRPGPVQPQPSVLGSRDSAIRSALGVRELDPDRVVSVVVVHLACADGEGQVAFPIRRMHR